MKAELIPMEIAMAVLAELPYAAGYYAFKNHLPHDKMYVLAHLDQLLDFGRPSPLFEKMERSFV